MPKLQFTPRTWLIVSISGYIIPTAAVYFIFLSPLFDRSDEARMDRQAAEEYVILKNTATQLAQFKERITERNDPVLFRASLDTVALKANVKIIGITPDSSVEQLNSGFLQRRVLVSVEGQYAQLNEFISRLEIINNYYTVSNMTVARMDDRSGKAQGQFTLRVLTVPLPKKPIRSNSDTSGTTTSLVPGNRYSITV
ncbi:MAG: hypothetical protein HOH43_28480 [Candidatus Latescibacteria bacterium]|jgi:hypothetical protein|nr:hypothetical protein [Candidatus Latescibacterota bacterium]